MMIKQDNPRENQSLAYQAQLAHHFFFACSMLHLFLCFICVHDYTLNDVTRNYTIEFLASQSRRTRLPPRLKVAVKILKCGRKDNKSTPIIDIFCGLSFRPGSNDKRLFVAGQQKFATLFNLFVEIVRHSKYLR